MLASEGSIFSIYFLLAFKSRSTVLASPLYHEISYDTLRIGFDNLKDRAFHIPRLLKEPVATLQQLLQYLQEAQAFNIQNVSSLTPPTGL